MDNNTKQFNKNAKGRMLTRGKAANAGEQRVEGGGEDEQRVEGGGEEGNDSQQPPRQNNRQPNGNDGNEESGGEDGEGGDGEDGQGSTGVEGDEDDRQKTGVGNNGIINIPNTNGEEDEDPRIVLRHNMWINNIRTAFARDELVKFQMLTTEYQKWCTAQETVERDPMLFEFEFEDRPVAPTPETCARTTTEVAVKSKHKVGAKISSGIRLTHNLPALSKHFDAIMRTRDSHMTVAIFDHAWIIADQAWMNSKRAPKLSCTSETIPYIGSTYPHEWRLDLAEWMMRFDLMVLYHREIYDKIEGQDPIADRLEAHKKIVLKIKAENHGAWPPAYRYDIANRRSVWEHWLADGTMADISQRNEDVLRQAISDSEFFKDDCYSNNPYVLGGSLQHKSPIDGKTYSASAPWDSVSAAVANETLAKSTAGRMMPHLDIALISNNSNNGNGSQFSNIQNNYNKNNYQYAPYNKNQSKRNGGGFFGGGGGFPNGNNYGNNGGGGYGSNGGGGGSSLRKSTSQRIFSVLPPTPAPSSRRTYPVG